MKLTIYNLFPERLNLYGDRGNVMVLRKRCEWRGIETDVVPIQSASDVRLSEADLLFLGGGSDRDQQYIAEELKSFRSELKAAVEDGVGCLAICGGYQMLGSYYQTLSGDRIAGAEVLEFATMASTKRLVGNCEVVMEDGRRIEGFENHSGRTYHSYTPLGKVVKGGGNNGEDQTEGLLYHNVIGTYLHGPFLPRNEFMADRLIAAALERKYGTSQLQAIERT